MQKYDAIVIGSGPAGQKAAIAASKLGKKVAIIESWDLGGSSLHTGTIPSKTLREAILDLTNFKQKSFYAKNNTILSKEKISITDLSHRVSLVKARLKQDLSKQLKKNHISLYYGHAKFLDPHTIEVLERNGEKKQLKADFFFLATGSQPKKPSNIPFDSKHVLTSTEFLSIDQIPRSLIVIGAGIIGCEYASMMSILGVKVTLIDQRKRLLSFLDNEIASMLQIDLEEEGLEFHRETKYTNIEVKEDRVFVTLENGSTISAEKVLITAGREANVQNLQLEKCNLSVNEKGYIEVDPKFQTNQKHIFGVGDVIGGPCLSSTGYIQGAYAANCAFSKKDCKVMNAYPYAIWTIPEISYIGETEQSLQEKGIDYEVGRAYFYEISRCVITGNKTGVCKILFDRKKFTLLGAHIIGRGAAEVIHIAQLAISLNAKIQYFVDHVFNFPTYAEMYVIAARNGLNKVAKTKKKKSKEEKV